MRKWSSVKKARSENWSADDAPTDAHLDAATVYDFFHANSVAAAAGGNFPAA